MKALLSAGGVALILGVLFFASRSRSEPDKAAARPQVGLVNMAYVLKNYEKVNAFSKESKDEFIQYDQTLGKLKAEIDQVTKEAQDKDLSDDDRQDLNLKLKKLKRKHEDVAETAKAVMDRKQEKQTVILYKDIRQAAERYAKAHDLDLVLEYFDTASEAERDSPNNIMNKMQQRAALPLYMAPGVDISKEIVRELNKGLGD